MPGGGADALTFGVGGLGGTAGSQQNTGGTGTLGTLGGGGNSTQNNTAQKVLLSGMQGKDSAQGPGKMRPFEGPSASISRLDINVRDTADVEGARDQQRASKVEGGRSSSIIENSRNGEGSMRQSSRRADGGKENFATLQELREN